MASSAAGAPKRCYYEILGLSRDCSPTDIKLAFRRLALTLHPDKQPPGSDIAAATAAFQELQHAHSVLSDPHERAYYDSYRSQILFSDPSASASGGAASPVPDLFAFFSSSAFSGFSDTGRGFYKVYGDVFDKVFAQELAYARRMGVQEPASLPVIGNLDSPYAQVTAFYSYWLVFATVMDFGWAVEWDSARGENRHLRRLMEEDNKKAMRKAWREYNDAVRGLAAFCKKRDKRVVDMALKKKAEEEKRKAEERERKKEEEKRKKEEEKRKKERAMAYQEPEWARVEEEEGMFDEEEEEEMRAKRKEEFYCVACNKKFKSDKQWKNHEQSKKHREKIAELRMAFKEEEAALKEAEEVEGDGDEVDVGFDFKPTQESDENESEWSDAANAAEELAEELEEGLEVHDKEDCDKDLDNAEQEVGLYDETSVLEAMLSRRKNKGGYVVPPAEVSSVGAELEDDDISEFNNVKKKGRRRRASKKEQGENTYADNEQQRKPEVQPEESGHDNDENGVDDMMESPSSSNEDAASTEGDQQKVKGKNGNSKKNKKDKKSTEKKTNVSADQKSTSKGKKQKPFLYTLRMLEKYMLPPNYNCLTYEQVKGDEENYIGLLVRTSLMLARVDSSAEVHCYGAKMIEHLLKCRHEELSSPDCLNLTTQLVASLDKDGILNLGLSFDAPESELRIIASEKSTDILHIHMLGSDGKAASHQVKGLLLLVEHKILCEAFYITSALWNPQYKSVLLYLLKLLNAIWTQPEWESTFLCNGFGLSYLFSDGLFLKTVYDVVEFFEYELIRNTQCSTDDICYLLHVFLPFLLQLLRCIHSLWKDQIACNLSEELKNAKVLSNHKEDQQNKTGKLLEQIRDSGYNIIGLSMCLEEAFTNLLDRSSFSLAFVNLDSMEFKHLSRLIKFILLPLVNNCPPELWKEWMLNFLGPFIRHCEAILYYAWFSFLHEGRPRGSYYFGKLFGSTKDIEKLEYTILLQFTRDVSHLLGNLSSLESNGLLHRFEDVHNKRITYDRDLEPSTSLIGYLFVHGCFGRLRMSLFGYWVDDVAATKAVPFCCALVHFARVSTDERLRLFVSDELLPSVIKRLHDQLPCSIRHLIIPNDTVNKDLTSLCHESYNYLSSKSSAQGQDLMLECKGRGSAADDFTNWLAKLKEDLCVKAFSAAPEEFKEEEVKWNWEFQDEFERYLPVYIDILKEVDAMDDTLEHHYLDWDVLVQKLSPKFRSKYGINSREHPYLMAISYMCKRKFYSTTRVRNQRNMREILRELIARTPYIKGSDCPYSVIDQLQQSPETSFSTFAFDDVESSIHFLFDSVLYFWEPRFHPLIREGHKNLLLWIVDQLTNATEFEGFQPLTPSPEDFPLHLEPYALSYILTNLKTSEYAKAVGQARMHDAYDNHLSSGVLDDDIYKYMLIEDCYLGKDVDGWAVPCQFSDMDHDLIKLSLKRRAEIVKKDHQVQTYLFCLRGLLEDESRKDQVARLMNDLEVQGFFDIDDSHINWENKHFTELVDEFRNEVFADHCLPRHYVIQGIIDYRIMSLSKGKSQRSFEKVVGEACDRLTGYLPQFWRDTRHYRHDFYDSIREPLEKIFV